MKDRYQNGQNKGHLLHGEALSCAGSGPGRKRHEGSRIGCTVVPVSREGAFAPRSVVLLFHPPFGSKMQWIGKVSGIPLNDPDREIEIGTFRDHDTVANHHFAFETSSCRYCWRVQSHRFFDNGNQVRELFRVCRYFIKALSFDVGVLR